MCTSSFIISAHSLIVFLTESTPLAIVFVALSIVYPSFLSATFVLVYIHSITNLAVCHRFFMIVLCFLCECTKNFYFLVFFSISTSLSEPRNSLEYGCSRSIVFIKYLYGQSADLIKLSSPEVSVLLLRSCVRFEHER